MKTDRLSPEEATDLINSSLTEEDLTDLVGIKNDINANIQWGKVTDQAFGQILKSLEAVILKGGQGLVKRTPLESLFPRDRALLETGDKAQIRKHYVLLLLMKKLLGALKTRTKQTLAEIPHLSFEEEYGAMVALEDEEPEETERVVGFRCDDPETIPFLSSLYSEEGGICKHLSTTVRQVKASKWPALSCDQLHTVCRDCRTVIQRVLVANTKIPRKKEKCKHQYASWVEGKEGQVASCAAPSCDHVITEAEALQKINWVVAGLEPYGDDPSQDEVIIL